MKSFKEFFCSPSVLLLLARLESNPEDFIPKNPSGDARLQTELKRALDIKNDVARWYLRRAIARAKEAMLHRAIMAKLLNPQENADNAAKQGAMMTIAQAQTQAQTNALNALGRSGLTTGVFGYSDPQQLYSNNINGR
jgi:hypothetical protein